jgi:hypothetical protein
MAAFRAASRTCIMRNTLVAFGDASYSIPYFADLGNEVVMGIDHYKPGDLLLLVEL